MLLLLTDQLPLKICFTSAVKSRIAVEAVASDGVKLQSRAARFAGTLGNSAMKKTRLEPLLIGKNNNNTVCNSSSLYINELILDCQVAYFVTDIAAACRCSIFRIKSHVVVLSLIYTIRSNREEFSFVTSCNVDPVFRPAHGQGAQC